MIGGEAPIVYSQLINNSDTVYTQNRLVKYRHQPRPARPPGTQPATATARFPPDENRERDPGGRSIHPTSAPPAKETTQFPDPWSLSHNPLSIGRRVPRLHRDAGEGKVNE